MGTGRQGSRHYRRLKSPHTGPTRIEKPRVIFAGLQGAATGGGCKSSRYRDAQPAKRHRPQVTAVGSVIDRLTSSFRLHTTPASPLRDNRGATGAATFGASRCNPTRNTLEHRVEVVAARSLQAHPQTRGAHNGETLRQQPSQWLVREPIPARVTSAISVNALPQRRSTIRADFQCTHDRNQNHCSVCKFHTPRRPAGIPDDSYLPPSPASFAAFDHSTVSAAMRLVISSGVPPTVSSAASNKRCTVFGSASALL